MTVLEAKWDTQNAFESVRKEGLKEGKSEVVRNLVLDFGFSEEQAAKAAEVPVDFVRKIRLALDNRKK